MGKKGITSPLFAWCVWIFFIFHFSFFTSSCMREDLSLCETEGTSLELTFVYEREQEQPVDKRIHNIVVLLFDQDSLLFQTHNVEVTDFEETGTIRVPVDAGEYFVVAWGNIADELIDTRAETGNHFEMLRLTCSDKLTPFYAPSKQDTRSGEYEQYYVEVIENKINTHTLSFLPAFHRINVFLKGMNEEEDPDMEISLREVSRGYNLHLIPDEETTSYEKIPATTVKDDQEMLTSSFYLPHFDEDTPIRIEVQNRRSGQMDWVALEEVLRREDIQPEDGAALTIDILFTYLNGTLVEVTFPDWGVTITDPGF